MTCDCLVEGEESTAVEAIGRVSRLANVDIHALRCCSRVKLLGPARGDSTKCQLCSSETLRVLRRVLFFHRFSVPLGRVGTILRGPTLREGRVLRVREGVLMTGGRHVRRLVTDVSSVLGKRGGVSFTVFDGARIRRVFRAVFRRVPSGVGRLTMGRFKDVRR